MGEILIFLNSETRVTFGPKVALISMTDTTFKLKLALIGLISVIVWPKITLIEGLKEKISRTSHKARLNTLEGGINQESTQTKLNEAL